MFGDAGQARSNAAMLLMLIAATSSRTCTKLIVGGSVYFEVLTSIKYDFKGIPTLFKNASVTSN